MKLKHLGLNRTARLVLHDVGLLLHVPGIMALLSLPLCLWFGEYYAIKPFLETAIVSFIPAQLLYRCCSPKVDKTRLYHAMLIVALTWGVIPLLGAIPFRAIARTLAVSPNTPNTILNFQIRNYSSAHSSDSFGSLERKKALINESLFLESDVFEQ